MLKIKIKSDLEKINNFISFIKNDNILLILLYLIYVYFINNILLRFDFRYYIYSISFSFLLILPIIFFQKLAKLYFIFLFFIFLVPYSISILYAVSYNKMMSVSDMVAIFDTNLNEATGFIIYMYSFKALLMLLMLVIPYIYIYRHIDINKKYTKKYSLIFFIISFIFSSIEIGSMILKKNENVFFIPFSYYNAYIDYKNDLKQIFNLKSKHKNTFNNIKSALSQKQDELYVIVIGESASRFKHSLYGYERNTNPNLSKIKKELYLFDNVITPHASTYFVLRKVLTFAYDDKINLIFDKGSILDYFNSAGFKTFVISNQQSNGEYNNLIAALFSNAKEIVWTTGIDFYDNAQKYDEVVLEPYQKFLQDPAKKKVIFIHLMGSHTRYTERFPEDMSYFSKLDVDKNSKYSKLCQKRRNNYDDSIRYTDYILSILIDKLKQQNKISYLLYFSDHGDDVCDLKYDKYYGHNDTMKTDAMKNIPLILWTSSKYKNVSKNIVRKINNSLHKNYNSQDLIHTIIEISHLNNKDFEKKRSILN